MAKNKEADNLYIHPIFTEYKKAQLVLSQKSSERDGD